MKTWFIYLSVGAALFAGNFSIAAQEKKATENESSSSDSGSSRSKRKSTSSSARKVTINAEGKALSYAVRSSDRMRPLIVRSSEGDSKATTQLSEDLAVMARIIEKKAAEYRDEHEEAAGIPIVVLAGSRGVRAIYLDDYGVLFTMTVNMPLRADGTLDDADNKEDKSATEEWTEARNEVLGRNRGERVARHEIDPRQMEEFRGAMIEALRNAANIRNLRPTDWITLVVRGRGDEEMDRRFDVFLQSGTGDRGVALPPGLESGGEASTMVLRVKKSDLDQAAKQPQNLDEFRKKVSVTLY